MRALFVLTPTESKRLIGKAVAETEEVKKAKESANIFIGHGSTNVYVAEEILGKEKLSELLNRDAYQSGLVKFGMLCTTPGDEKPPMLVLNRGSRSWPVVVGDVRVIDRIGVLPDHVAGDRVEADDALDLFRLQMPVHHVHLALCNGDASIPCASP